jgi:hypothetical protein
MNVRTLHFGPSHPLAEIAARHCETHFEELLGEVACGECWERAIRDDERVAAECGLARDLVANPAYIDDVAVELACRGERVPLTPAERAVAARQLRSTGLPPVEIARRLRVGYAALIALLDGDTGRVA